MKISPYVLIARPDHWYKNLLFLPGVVFSSIESGRSFVDFLFPMVVIFFALCLISSASYVLNEWLDAPFDRFHPVKNKRYFAVDSIKSSVAYTEHAAFAVAGFSLVAVTLPRLIPLFLLFYISGVVYNVRPFRLKDRVYVDVLAESFNNPLRLYIGWFVIIVHPLPPASLVCGYWFAAAFVLGFKRFAEMRMIGNMDIAGAYRASFKHYNRTNLLCFISGCSVLSWLFLLVFILTLHRELLLSIPFIGAVFAWLWFWGIKPRSPLNNLEGLPKNKIFSILLIAMFVVIWLCLRPTIPGM